jgi:glutathione-regulated potassium-efflux system ancillary protein KefC
MEDYFIAIGVVVTCSAILGWLACCSRQPIVLAYFLCGVLIGPGALRLIGEVSVLEHISRIGVTLLLFLAGLVLHPDRLLKFFRSTLIVTLGGCVLTWGVVFTFLRLLGYAWADSNIGALALMFSSTILVIKLLPTTTLHQKRMGSICIAVLIAEDLLAVVLLLFVGTHTDGNPWLGTVVLLGKAVLFIAAAVCVEQFVLRWMMRRADRYNEVLVMLCLAWCLGLAVLAELMGLSYEVGAFVAGVSIARGKIALVLSEELKPLRDFFLMFFFFVLGTRLNLFSLKDIWLAAVVLALLIVVLRPLYLRWLFRSTGEEPAFAREIGFRMGQGSEFALIVVAAALDSGRLSGEVSQLVQLTTMLTMVISSYVVVFKFATPIGFRAGLQKD